MPHCSAEAAGALHVNVAVSKDSHVTPRSPSSGSLARSETQRRGVAHAGRLGRSTPTPGRARPVRSPKRDVGRRYLAASVFALAGLRPPLSAHPRKRAPAYADTRPTPKRSSQMEVAEGAPAWETRQRMAHTEICISSTPTRGAGRSSSARSGFAHRLDNAVARGSVTWIEALSHEVAPGRSTPMDFLCIDGDCDFDAVSIDWHRWTPPSGRKGPRGSARRAHRGFVDRSRLGTVASPRRGPPRPWPASRRRGRFARRFAPRLNQVHHAARPLGSVYLGWTR